MTLENAPATLLVETQTGLLSLPLSSPAEAVLLAMRSSTAAIPFMVSEDSWGRDAVTQDKLPEVFEDSILRDFVSRE